MAMAMAGVLYRDGGVVRVVSLVVVVVENVEQKAERCCWLCLRPVQMFPVNSGLGD